MWRDAVKTTLHEEKARWLEEREDGADIEADVEIVSVTRLLQLLYGGSPSSELRERWGIDTHDISPKDSKSSRSLKRPRVESGDRTARAGAVAYTSRQAWITGFLRYEHAQAKSRRAPRLCLCDATNKIPVRLIEPRLELLEALVLVKHWTVVSRGPSDVLTPNGSLEVRSELVLLHSAKPPTVSIHEALGVMRIHYPAADPPMYVGSKTWERAIKNEVPSQDDKKPKKRKFHVVFGRVSSVSPIAVQEDAANSHFFVEVEDWEGQDRAKSLVNVLLAGAAALQWHQFLWPGLLVMMTNLKKVYYSESEMFLLQAVLNADLGPDNGEVCSSLFIWRSEERPSEPLQSAAALERVKIETRHFEQCEKTTLDCEAVVASIMWEECLVLEGEPSIVVTLFHYPWSDIRPHVRVGTRVRVCQAHVISQPHPGHQRLVIGLCPRSHLRIISHAPADSQLHSPTAQVTDPRRRLHKKWSIFGDFSKQPLAISMWWLTLLEVLVQKFRFCSDTDDDVNDVQDIAFVCLRRREATLHIGQEVLTATTPHSKSSSTLARRFLNSHTEDSQDCPSAGAVENTTYLEKRVVTVKELRDHIERIVRERIENDTTTGDRIVWPLRVEASGLSSIIAMGSLRGFADTDDLELVDSTGQISLVIERINDLGGVKIERGCCVYAVRNFEAMVEFSNQQPLQSSTRSPHVISLAASTHHLQRVALCSSPHAAIANVPNTSKRSSVYVFVTDIGPWKRHRRTSSRVNDFRHVRGIGFQRKSSTDTSPDWSSAHCVEVLVSATSECWFVERYSWICTFDVIVHPSVPGTTSVSRLAKWLTMMILWIQKSDASNDVATVPTFEEQVQAQWAKSAEEIDSIETTTYVVDRESFVQLIEESKENTSKQNQYVQPSHALHADASIQRCLDALEGLARRLDKIYSVQELFLHEPPTEAFHHVVTSSIESDPHTARLINLVGIVSERTLYYKISRGPALLGELPEAVPAIAKTTRMCRFKIRDLRSLEAVAITVDEDAFGTLSAVQPGTMVEFSKLQCFLARNTFKPFITWTHCTTVRRVRNNDEVHPTDAQIFSSMATTHLSSLYKSQPINRTITRFVVRLAHVSYVVLKRRCSQCKQPLALVKRQRMWVHVADVAEESSAEKPQHKCSWKQLAQDSPVFNQQTSLSCSMRCIVDDGSAQSELFAENEVVWEVLRCSRGRRRRFEELLQRQTSELSYFATRSATDSLFTYPSTQENLYYQNEWRAFVQGTVASISSVVVFAQRFYKNQSTKDAPQTAVISFGKDIQVTIPSAPLAQLEAIRVDELHPRNELRKRLASSRFQSIPAAKGH